MQRSSHAAWEDGCDDGVGCYEDGGWKHPMRDDSDHVDLDLHHDDGPQKTRHLASNNHKRDEIIMDNRYHSCSPILVIKLYS